MLLHFIFVLLKNNTYLFTIRNTAVFTCTNTVAETGTGIVCILIVIGTSLDFIDFIFDRCKNSINIAK